MNKYLVLDIDIFTKELESHFKPAVFGSNKYILTEYDVKDILLKSHVENVKIYEQPQASEKEEPADLDSLIDSRKWRRYYI